MTCPTNKHYKSAQIYQLHYKEVCLKAFGHNSFSVTAYNFLLRSVIMVCIPSNE